MLKFLKTWILIRNSENIGQFGETNKLLINEHDIPSFIFDFSQIM